MKFNERLYIGSKQVEPISWNGLLSYRNPGTAQVVTNEKPTMQEIIAYEFGYDNRLTRWFTGYVDSYTQLNDGKYSLFCRELTGTFRNPLPLFDQHLTLTELLTKIAARTALHFITSDEDYTRTIAPYICNHGTGYALLDSLGDVYNIDRYMWQQQGDGRIYVGSWNQSVWYGRNIALPYNQIETASMDTAIISANPLLRPGVLINGQRIRNIQQNKEKMVITWMTK